MKPPNKGTPANHHSAIPSDAEWKLGRAFRASGTEPLIRCYIEAKSMANLKKLQTACRELLKV